jgi:fructosamine-3-kinase
LTSGESSHLDLPVGEALRAELGSPTPVRRLPSSPRSRVWLVEFGATPAIVKQIVGGADADERYGRELTALTLAGRQQPPVVPALLATDPATRVLILEYLSTPGNNGRSWAVEYAAALARLHAAAGLADADAMPGQSTPAASDVQAFLDLAGELQVPIPARAPAELQSLLSRLESFERRALLHGDPCPGNVLQTPDGVRFVDLEQASIGDGATELAYLRAGFPTCWCVTRIPPAVLVEAEAAYLDMWRSLTGTEPPGDLTDACAGWLIQGDALVERARRGAANHLARLSGEDWHWGTATARQRLLHRLDLVAAAGAERADLSDVAQLSRAMHSQLLRHWPDLVRLPVFERLPDPEGFSRL